MSTLRDRTRSYIDEHRLDGKDFAKFAGVSGSSLSRFLKHAKAGYAVRHKIDAALDGHVHVQEEECDPDALAELTERVEDSLVRIGAVWTSLDATQRDVSQRYGKTIDMFNAAYLREHKDRKRLNRAMVVGTLMWLGLLAFVIVN